MMRGSLVERRILLEQVLDWLTHVHMVSGTSGTLQTWDGATEAYIGASDTHRTAQCTIQQYPYRDAMRYDT